MRFVREDSPAPAAAHIAREIARAAHQAKRVLWLISGGSAIDIAVLVRQKLDSTKDLTVMQVDERFGPVGHQDSNWQQLLDAGFDPSGIKCRPALTGESIAETAQSYGEALDEALLAADVTIGLFGIGDDGHTAGILPNSPAVDSQHLVESYTASDFQRITITPAAIAKLELAVVYVAAAGKHQALERLKQELPIAEQPAQALKMAKSTYVYNDYTEGTI